MKFETIKTIILILLVGLSLILTFGLWNHQPNFDQLYDPQSDYVNEVSVGGVEASRKTIVQPTSIIFHTGGSHFGFQEPRERRSFYQDMQDWALEDIQLDDASGEPDKEENIVEITFPVQMPAEIINSLFTINEEDRLPDWSFNKMFITFDQSNSQLELSFMSLNGEKKVTSKVSNSNVYKNVWGYMTDPSELSEQLIFEGDQEVYVPETIPELKKRSFTAKDIEPRVLVDALFRNPSLVSPNIGEAYFTDGQRGLRVVQDGKSMEFINPIQSTEDDMEYGDLLDLSLENINMHRGWTDGYYLADINLTNNQVRYQMHYEGYPVFNSSNLSVIEQEWRNNELHQYRRPLFSLNNLLGGDVIDVPSGEETINYIEGSSDYKTEDVKDIQLGYKLNYLEGSSYSATLEPAWYILYKNKWEELPMDSKNEGGD